MPLQQTSGNVTADAFGGGVAAVPNYIEDVFSTWLYTGTGAAQAIVNGVGLATYGGMTWLKRRDTTGNHGIFDTARGANNRLITNTTDANGALAQNLNSFDSTGFTVGTSGNYNASAATYASWTFRKKPKFFDVVTYTGTGSNRTISHSLGSAPGCIIVKRTDTTSDWQVYHNGLTSAAYGIQLDLTNAQSSDTTLWNSTAPTTSVFSLGTNADVNASGGTYVAYLFAHNAGGFGLTGTDNVISCGSFTNGAGATATITLGYEPQFVILKPSSGTGNWVTLDTMRGWSQSTDALLFPNTSGAEVASELGYPTATGFNITGGFSSTTYIYIAIRRGPMKVPTDATKVFNVVSQSPSGTTTVTNLFSSDMVLACQRSGAAGWGFNLADKLRGSSIAGGSTNFRTSSTAAEGALTAGYGWDLTNTNIVENWMALGLGITTSTVYNIFQRAPGFFDEVCYKGTGSATTQIHNLGVTPELIIIKQRGSASSWCVYEKDLGPTNGVYLNLDSPFQAGVSWMNSTVPTSTVFSLGTSGFVNDSAATYVAYLFATCPGVSKVGSYTGNGTTQTINCGFTAGARFVLIKQTDATGDWYTYDTARGMTTLTDPYLLMNSTAAEVATLGSVTTVTTGFALNSAITAAINVSGGTYIYLSIA